MFLKPTPKLLNITVFVSLSALILNSMPKASFKVLKLRIVYLDRVPILTLRREKKVRIVSLVFQKAHSLTHSLAHSLTHSPADVFWAERH